MTKNSFFKKRNRNNQSKVTAVLGQSEMILGFIRLTKSTYTKYMCKKINNMITWVRISPIARSFQDALFKPKYDLLTSHSVRDMCGSNLGQSRGYKISLESLLHRVQSRGQREVPGYRSHCPLFIQHRPYKRSVDRCSGSHLCKSWCASFNSWVLVVLWRSEHLFFYHP